ncbi:hypothetical protein CP8484711_2313B, partial [Chlamydia psittaci 84-8471/1]
NISAGGP